MAHTPSRARRAKGPATQYSASGTIDTRALRPVQIPLRLVDEITAMPPAHRHVGGIAASEVHSSVPTMPLASRIKSLTISLEIPQASNASIGSTPLPTQCSTRSTRSHWPYWGVHSST